MLRTFPHLADIKDVTSAHGVAWLDLLDPSEAEIQFVESSTGLRVPTRAALSEIESTSRSFMENGAIYLSAPLIARARSEAGALSPVGFVLTPNFLITVRFAEMKAFDAVIEVVGQMSTLRSEEAFVRLMETIVDAGADLLEHVGAELQRLSWEAFRGQNEDGPKQKDANPQLREALRSIGRMGDRTSQIRDSLLGLARITGYVVETGCHGMEDEFRQRLNAVRADITSLNDYEEHLANKVQFLLDATLGFISIEQNDVVKVLTIASIVGVPPVLVAGIYGMNFKIIPEYNWAFGYPYALILMVLSAVLPLLWFKWRGWM